MRVKVSPRRSERQRDVWPSDVVRCSWDAEPVALTVMFTDIVGSTSLNERLGDIASIAALAARSRVSLRVRIGIHTGP
jgi:class 3 adenylate cyclase